MQNWHLGPIGFQVLIDQAMFLYADALEIALESMINKKQLDRPSTAQELTYSPPSNCASHVKDDARTTPVLLYKYWCTEEGFNNANFYCATGFLPQWTIGSNLGVDMFEPAAKRDNAFPKIGNGASEWKWVQHKSPSGIGHASEMNEANYVGRPECSTFIDIGFSLRTAQAAVQTEWLALEIPLAATKALKGVKKVHVFICTGQRDKGFSDFGNFTAVFGVNGKVWGEGSVGPWGQCFRLNQPNALEVFSTETILGVRFISPSPTVKMPVIVGEVLLIGEEGDVTPVPSNAMNIPTAPPVANPTQQPVVIPNGKDDDGDDPNKPTVVPHPDDDDDDPNTPTVVPHPDDDDDDPNKPTVVPHPGDDRRRRRIRRQRRLHTAGEVIRRYV